MIILSVVLRILAYPIPYDTLNLVKFSKKLEFLALARVLSYFIEFSCPEVFFKWAKQKTCAT